MKSTLIILLTFLTINGFSQISSTWKGNAPGHEVEWDFASNWSNNRIPDEFTDVLIPVDITLSNNYPVIRHGNVEVNSLTVNSGAHIQIEPACIIHMLISDLMVDSASNKVQVTPNGKVELE